MWLADLASHGGWQAWHSLWGRRGPFLSSAVEVFGPPSNGTDLRGLQVLRDPHDCNTADVPAL